MQSMLTAIISTIENGGAIMLPIVICCFALWVMIIERMLTFRSLEKDDLDLSETLELVRQGERGEEKAGLRRDLVRFMAIHATGSAKVDESLLDQYRLHRTPLLTKRMTMISTLAAVAPLLGLLGTVSGMITTFDVIAIFGTGNARAMAGGISESLITTQSGLTVAIPGMFMGVWINRRARQVSDKLDETISTLSRTFHGPGKKKTRLRGETRSIST